MLTRGVARNFQWGVGLAGGLQLSEAGGLGAKSPAAGGKGVWGRISQHWAILAIF